ncbi:MAG: RNA 3'-terminal phosphate cyclase [Nitrospirae bacterium]|nr:RNA 3'-terminal phosphate cyclase [Nitrospirota bacterium]
MVDIDGSYGEGGGQIVRTALGLSCLFRKPFTIHHVRKGRKKPGLMPQHLTCVSAARLISGAVVEGDRSGCTELTFSPGEPGGGTYSFDIGTAGSTSLLLQAVIPALLFTGRMSSVTLVGGTHVPFSPPFHFLSGVFVPFLERLGVKVQLSIETYGFYPKGGGRIRANIFPADRIGSLDLLERGEVRRVTGCSGVGGLPPSIASRQQGAALAGIRASASELSDKTAIDTINVPTHGQGTFVYLECRSESSLAGFSALGARGKRAEAVGDEAAGEFINYYRSGAALDRHLADQIVLYLALSGHESAFTTEAVTDHLLTNLWAIGLFHRYRYSVEGRVGEKGTVRITPPKEGPGAG